MTKRTANWQGSKWIRPERRLAIYLRDGLACIWCGASIEEGALLSLDHVKPHVNGGGNENGNLVTCCKTCNSSRGSRPVATFAKVVASYLGVDAKGIIQRVRNATRRNVDLAEAKAMIARRGTKEV